jgi:hypothetical protein
MLAAGVLIAVAISSVVVAFADDFAMLVHILMRMLWVLWLQQQYLWMLASDIVCIHCTILRLLLIASRFYSTLFYLVSFDFPFQIHSILLLEYNHCMW